MMMPAKTTSIRAIRRVARRLSPGLSLTCLSVALTGCQKPDTTVTPEVTVQATRPHPGEISEVITGDATLSPLSQAAISPRITAPVKQFLVQRGARVYAGEVLARLENSDLAASALENQGAYAAATASYQTATLATVPEDYSKARLDLAQSKANLDLNQNIVDARTKLFAEGAIPGRDLDTAKAGLVQAQAAYNLAEQHLESVQKTSNKASPESAKGQLESAKGKYLGSQAQLAYTEIRSPIDGVVTDRPLFAGETAAAGTPLLTVMDTSVLLAKLHIAQKQAQQLAVGAAATVEVPGMDHPADAKVSLISPALDPGSTTVEVWLRIENQGGLLKAGTPVHVSIAGTISHGGLLLPAEALQTSSDGSRFVMLIADKGVAHKQPVKVGIESKKEVQILAGVTVEDIVITTGAYGVDDGTKVKVDSANDRTPRAAQAEAGDSQ